MKLRVHPVIWKQSASLLALFILFNNHAFADPETPNRDRVVAFLKNHVIEKTLYSKSSGQDKDPISGDVYAWDFERTWTFTNLRTSERGLLLDAFVNIKQTRYDVVDEKRVNPGKSSDRSILVRFEAQEMRSTGQLFGFARYVAFTGVQQDPTGQAMSLVMKLDGDELVLSYTDVLTSEWLVGTTNKWQLMSCDNSERLHVVDGKLVRDWGQHCYLVDPETLERTKEVSNRQTYRDTER